MYGKRCDQCGEYKQLTHRIKSDILDMIVCYQCRVNAEILQSPNPGIGTYSITLVEQPKVIPLFFECSLCHGKFRSAHHYEEHYKESHG